MKCKDITNIIEETFPLSAALSFDHVGLQAGREDKEVKKIYIALDATSEVIDHAVEFGADMIITHHPLIFSPLATVTDKDFIGRRVVKMIQNDISYYAMHTNFDVIRMADMAADIFELQDVKVLETTISESEDNIEMGIGKIGTLKEDITLEKCAIMVKDRLGLDGVKISGNKDGKVKTFAICPGSGKDAVDSAIEKGADVLVAGDMGHHTAVDALERGLFIIDAGHYGTEYIFIEDMKKYIEKTFCNIEVKTESIKNTFTTL